MKLLRILGAILLFTVLVEFSPIIILVFMVAVFTGNGESVKEKAVNVLDKLKRMITC